MSPWDLGYYLNQILKTNYQVDQELIREYLPMDQTLNGMFAIFEKLLGVGVFLELFVRVQKNWTRDTRALRKFGY